MHDKKKQQGGAMMSQTFYSIHDYYISHHGIKGQKWGIRRYQNPDGTLTELGKKRYGTVENMKETRERSKQRMIKIAKGLGIAAVSVGAIAGAVALSGPVKTAIAGILRKQLSKYAAKFGASWEDNGVFDLVKWINKLEGGGKIQVEVSAGATKI
jgi:hypothetical protein